METLTRVQKNRLRLYKIAKTICLVMTTMSMGMYLELSGPSLPDLKLRTGSNYEEVSRALVARSVGYFIGSLSGGFLRDYFKRHADLILGGAVLLASIGTAVAPWSRVLALLGCMLHLQGLGQGIVDTVCQSSVIHLWGKNAPAPIHSLHLGFGIGALLSPLLVREFLADEDGVSTGNITSGNNLQGNINSGNDSQGNIISGYHTQDNTSVLTVLGTNMTPSPTYDPWLDSEIQWAWLIVACLVFVISMIFIGFYVFSLLFGFPKGLYFPRTVTAPWRLLLPSTCAKPGNTWKFSTVMMVLLSLYYVVIVGGERVFSKFIYSFGVESDLQISRQDAAVLNTVFWISFTCGRLLSTLTAAFVAPFIMLAVLACINLILGIVLVCFGVDNEVALWVLTGGFGAFMAPLFPTGVAWASKVLNITGMALAVFSTGSAIGGFIFQWVTGALFEYHGPSSMTYVVLVYGIVLCCLVAVLQSVAYVWGPNARRSQVANQLTEIDGST